MAGGLGWGLEVVEEDEDEDEEEVVADSTAGAPEAFLLRANDMRLILAKGLLLLVGVVAGAAVAAAEEARRDLLPLIEVVEEEDEGADAAGSPSVLLPFLPRVSA